MMIWNDAIAIGIGACFGAMSRYQIGKAATEYIATDPNKYKSFQGWHTAGINIVGSFILGGITATPTITALILSPTELPDQYASQINPKQDITKRIISPPPSTPPSSIIRRQLSGPLSLSKSSTTIPRLMPWNNINILKNGLSPRTKLCLGVGFCGSFTTFSTFSVDFVQFIQQGHTNKALSYIIVNNVGGITAALTGMILVKKLFSLK